MFLLTPMGVLAAAADRETPAICCPDAWNWLTPAPAATELALTAVPDGARAWGAGVLWQPATRDVGLHDLRGQCRLADGTWRPFVCQVEVRPLRRALFVLAHQDDEFGIVPKLVELHRRGVECRLVWMNGGNATRNQEARAAMALAGLPAGNLDFLQLEDVESPQGFARHAAYFRDLLSRDVFDQLYVPAYEGGHEQHDLIHAAAVRGARDAGFQGMIYEFGLYHLEHGLPMPFSLLPAPAPVIQMTVDDATLDLVQRMARCHRSQRPLVYGFVYGMSRTRKTHPEYRPLPAWDYSRPPTADRLWYEANPKHPGAFARFRQAVGGSFPATAAPRRWAQDVPAGTRLIVPDRPGQAVVAIHQPYSLLAWLAPAVLAGLAAIPVSRFIKRRRKRHQNMER